MSTFIRVLQKYTINVIYNDADISPFRIYKMHLVYMCACKKVFNFIFFNINYDIFTNERN